MKTLSALVLGAAAGAAATWAVMRDAESATSSPTVVEKVVAVPDAGVQDLAAKKPTRAHVQTAAAISNASSRERELAARANELSDCGTSVTVLTIATAKVTLSTEGVVRPKRLVIEPASEQLDVCLREKLTAMKLSRAERAEDVSVRFRFEPQ